MKNKLGIRFSQESINNKYSQNPTILDACQRIEIKFK